jgi:pseudouridine-5'-phosphate glycosidase
MKIKYSEEVIKAKKDNLPIVALESTIITHGMPYPENLKTALAVENIIRDQKSVPATIGVLDGNIQIGHSFTQLETLAKERNVRKLSRADLPFCISNGSTGSTTVAATMICASMAEIKIFATGGIGGVHLDAKDTFDISADLNELSKTNVSVVSAGPKAILDIPKTIEFLETLGVPVISYQSDEIPAFWSRKSGCMPSIQINKLIDIANFIKARDTIGLQGGCLITNPVPKKNEIPITKIKPIIKKAILDGQNQGITGKDLTPFLLNKIFELTDGESLLTNIALIKNNAKIAAKLSKLMMK